MGIKIFTTKSFLSKEKINRSKKKKKEKKTAKLFCCWTDIVPILSLAFSVFSMAVPLLSLAIPFQRIGHWPILS